MQAGDQARELSRESVGAAVFVVAAIALGWLAMGDVGFRDAGELGTAGFTLGVAHPTGFAIDMLWLRLSALLPLGHLALRQNLLGALIAAGALAVLAQLCARVAWRVELGPGASAGAWVAALGLGTWSTFLTAARAVEVYASALLAVLLVASWLLRGPAGARPSVLLVGLSPGLHVTTGLYAALLLGVRALTERAVVRALLAAAPLLLVGALVIAYLPLASLRQPPLDWGDPETAGALLSHLTAARIRSAYHDEMLGAGGDAGPVAGLLLPMWPLWPLALLGAWWVLRRARGVGLAGVSLWVLDLAYAAFVNPMGAVDRQVGHVAGAMVALGAGLGMALLVTALRARGAGPWAVRIVPGVLVALLLMRFDTSMAQDGHAAGELLGSGGPLAQLPARSVLICASDDACSGALFALHVEGVRPDVDVAPAQHLWDATVVRRLRGMEALADGEPAVDARGDAALARVKRLVTERWPRPILWESDAPLRRLGYPGEVAAAPVPTLLQARPVGQPRGFPHGVVARLDGMRRARLSGGMAREGWARDAWSSAYGRVGKAALMTKGTAEGLAALRTATQLSPTRAVAWINLGVGLETVADLPGAIEATRRAVLLEPARATGWVNLARLYEAAGQRQDARRVLDAAFAAGVRDERLQKMRAALQ